MNHERSIQNGQGMSIHALLVLATRNNYDELKMKVLLESLEKIRKSLLSTIYNSVIYCEL